MAGRKGKPNYNNQKAPGEASYNVVYSCYRYNAKKKNFQFDLDKETFKKIVSQNCYYCGEKPKDYNPYIIKNAEISHVGVSRAWIKVNGVDRLDSNLGYIKENCITCCSVCNKMKLKYTVNFFIQHIFKIARHMVKQKFRINPFF